jgi:lipoate-protein ligase A
MSDTWRFINSGQASGAINMAIDEAILESVIAGRSGPTLRVYEWNPPCISVGYAQSLAREVDIERCRASGVEWVRRPTGGRLIFHDNELTYSVVSSGDNPLVSGGILESYRKISAGLTQALALLGVNAELADPRHPKSIAASKARSGLCFNAASGYEVKVSEGKLVGSAQVRRCGTVLQHGSLLIDYNVARIFDIVRHPEGQALEEFAADFARRVASLTRVLGQVPAKEEVATAFQRGFAIAWDVEMREGELSPYERDLVVALAEKYSSDEWNLAR